MPVNYGILVGEMEKHWRKADELWDASAWSSQKRAQQSGRRGNIKVGPGAAEGIVCTLAFM